MWIKQKFAESIVYRLDKDLFVEAINKRSVTVRELLVACFIEIIRSSTGLFQQSALEKQAQQKNALELKINMVIIL